MPYSILFGSSDKTSTHPYTQENVMFHHYAIVLCHLSSLKILGPAWLLNYQLPLVTLFNMGSVFGLTQLVTQTGGYRKPFRLQSSSPEDFSILYWHISCVLVACFQFRRNETLKPLFHKAFSSKETTFALYRTTSIFLERTKN